MKVSKKQCDNRGLTLIELVVAVAISVVALGAIWQFVLVSTRSYESQTAEAELQQEVQQTMNQVQNLLIDTNRAVAYYYEEGGSYKQFSNDYDNPQNASKRLEVYNDGTKAQLIWDKESQEVIYKEAVNSEGGVEVASNEENWESAVLAEGVEALGVDVSQVEEKQVLKVKMSFSRNNKTYTATKNIAMRNSVLNTADEDEIYGGTASNDKLTLTVKLKNQETKFYRRKTYEFVAEVKDKDGKQLTGDTILWTVQGQKCADTHMDVQDGKLIIGALEEEEGQLTVIATLESDRTVWGIYSVTVAETAKPTVTMQVDPAEEKRTAGIGGLQSIGSNPGGISANLVINALCGEENVTPVYFTVNPVDYAYTWEMRTLDGKTSVDADLDFYEKDKARLLVKNSQTEDFLIYVNLLTNEEYEPFVCYVNVVPPLPEIVIENSGKSESFYGGSQITIKADWDRVTVENSKKKFGYDIEKDIIKENKIEWTITELKDDEPVKSSASPYKTLNPDESMEFMLPYYSESVNGVRITALSTKYPNMIIQEKVVKLTPSELTLSAYKLSYSTVGNSTDVKKSEFSNVNGEVPELDLYQDIEFVPEFKGGDVKNLEWTVIFDENEENAIVVKRTYSSDEKAVIQSDGKAVWNTVKTYFGTNIDNKMFGHTVTVRVSDANAPASNPISAEVTFKVKDVAKCEKVTPNLDILAKEENLFTGKEYKYLHPQDSYDEKLFKFYGFNVELGDHADKIDCNNLTGYSLDKDGKLINKNIDSEWCIDVEAIDAKNAVRFTPKRSANISGIKYIVYDVDDKYTGEHLGYLKLCVQETDSIFDGKNKNSVALFIDVEKVKWESCTREHSDYCNYYGVEYIQNNEVNMVKQAKKYQCNFTNPWYSFGQWVNVDIKDCDMNAEKYQSTGLTQRVYVK